MAKSVENRTGAVPDPSSRRPIGRVLLDATSEGVLSVLLFFFGFLGWSVKWTLATLFFIGVMAAAAYLVFNEAVKGGGYVTVPSITGLPLTQAANVLAESGLELGTQTQVVSNQLPEYHVMLQRPAARKVIRTGRKVHITISSGKRLQVPPDLVGKDLASALSELGSTRFIAGAIARMPDDSPKDFVLAQDPASTREVTLGSSVHLLVSDGPASKPVHMPDLMGVTIEDAMDQLALERIQVDLLSVTRPGADYNVVLGQSLDPGSLLYEGQVVELNVRLLPNTSLANIKYTVDVDYTVPFTSSNPEIRVALVDIAGRRKTIFPLAHHFVDGKAPRFTAGSTITVPDVVYSEQATVEFYSDGDLDRTYFYDGNSAPVITGAERGGGPSDTVRFPAATNSGQTVKRGFEP